MGKKIIPHKTMVALLVFWRKANIFIHIECNYIFKTDLSGFAKADQFSIHSERGGTCWKAKHKWLL